MNQRKPSRKRNEKKTKRTSPKTATGPSAYQKPGVAQQSAKGTKWVRVTAEDVLKSLAPEERKKIEHWGKAVSCHQSEIDKLTPEQREWRAQYLAQKWPLHDAGERKFRETGNESKFMQAADALHDFYKQADWFAKNTPHPFKLSDYYYISLLAGVSCRYLRRLAERGNHHAITELATLTVEMTETLTDLLAGDPAKVEKNAKLMRHPAATLPYWPMLQFRHAAANNHFRRVADLLELGKECPINATEQAKYSLQTPINRFVWTCLKHFEDVHNIIRNALNPTEGNQTIAGMAAAAQNAERVLANVGTGKFNISPQNQPEDPIEKALEPYVFEERNGHTFGMIYRQEIPIYKASCKLAQLTKQNAQQWAEIAIMPYIRIRFPDLRQVEELHYLKKKLGATGKRYAPLRKAVIQAMQQLARKP